MSSSNAQTSTFGLKKIMELTKGILKGLVECDEEYELEITERKHLENKLEMLEQKFKILDSEKCQLAEKISSLNKSIENFLTTINEMQIELQVRDEKIKAQTEDIITKENQLKVLIDENDKLRNESSAIGQRLTNHFDAIMREIRFPEESSNNQNEGRQQLNGTGNLEQMTPINSVVAELNACQSSFNNQLRSVEANDFTKMELDASTQPTVTINDNKRILVDSNDESVPEQGNIPQNKRLKRSDSTSSSTSIYPNRPGLDNLVTSDINIGSVETLEAQDVPKDGSPNSENNETENADIKCSTSDNDNTIASQDLNHIKDIKRNYRKNIRQVKDFENLTKETRSAYQQEKDRKYRCVKNLHTYKETYGQLPGEVGKSSKLVLDFNPNTKKELLIVDNKLSALLKPYQREGVKFMWDACFESVETLQSSDGGGCILAHCMGLGKTLQVIALVHTLLSNQPKTNVKKVLIICPVNVIYNWKNEFEMWLKQCNRNKDINIYELFTCRPNKRGGRMESWHKEGGVLLIGYDMFRRLHESVSKMETTKMEKKEKNMLKMFQESVIDPGADLIVCDEGHLLKNPNSRFSKAVNKVTTLRRIILTGTPLQNNLSEYFCMVEFVKPRLLGTDSEFKNGFKNPIENGQYSDSKEEDILLMQLRSHILHKLLDGCVQRRDYSVLAAFLPPKQEFVLFIRLTDVQITLYKFFMKHFHTCGPIGDFAKVQKICNHPKVLIDFERRKQKLGKVQNIKKENDSENYSECDTESDNEHSEALSTTLPNDGISKPKWWTSLVKENEMNVINSSGKMLTLVTIINECEELGDKLLVFSNCLSTLNVIEQFLSELHKQKDPRTSSGFKGSWARDIDYFRLDGTKSIESRNRDINNFNSKNNLRGRLFLISTKAGGIGINLMAASRVVIFDASWNPSNDIQSIFRTYRIGQEKECFVYRLIALGTMEEKIYDRQITKLSLSRRVIDEHQIGRHYKANDLRELYSVDNLNPSDNSRRPDLNQHGERILNELLRKHSDVVFKYHDHDSLLEDKIEERLTKEEKEDAWGDFQETFASPK